MGILRQWDFFNNPGAIPVNQPPPAGGGGGGAPEPDVPGGDTILHQDAFEYASTAALKAAYATSELNGATITSFASGRSGKCARFTYPVAASPDCLIEKNFGTTVDVYFRYWFRILPSGGGPDTNPTGSGMKWFMPWRLSTSLRWTMGVGTLTGGPVGFTNVGFEFSGHDNLSGDMPNPFMQNIDKSIRFDTCNDGNWHKYTLRINTDPLGNSSGVGGFHQLWVDDVRLADSRPGQPGVGAGYTMGEEGIGLFQLPGLCVDGVNTQFTIDVDDIVVWHT